MNCFLPGRVANEDSAHELTQQLESFGKDNDIEHATEPMSRLELILQDAKLSTLGDCGLIADVNNPKSAIPQQLRLLWQKLDDRSRQAHLAESLQQVADDQAEKSVTDMPSEDWERFAASWFDSTERPAVE